MGWFPFFLVMPTGSCLLHFIVNDKYGAIAYFCYLFSIPGHSQASWCVYFLNLCKSILLRCKDWVRICNNLPSVEAVEGIYHSLLPTLMKLTNLKLA